MGRFKGRSILVGVTGGIAAYKAAELVRSFVKEGAGVQVVMTAGARQFITSLTLQVLSEQPVATDLFDLGLESQIGHIQLARAAHLVVVAPATANVLAKAAAGVADDYLTTVLLATTAPVLFCPAMNSRMYEHAVTRRNIEALRQVGYFVLEPDAGFLACHEEGAGRLPDSEVILEAASRLLTRPTLKGRRVLVSAGPTWEPLDPVRFITNPSSGKMGFAVARMAARRSADVTLVSGPSALRDPPGIATVRVRTAREMEQAILERAPGMDVVIMTAAVGDYRPADVAPQKIKKGAVELTLQLVRNPDILASLGRSRPPGAGQVLVGFAAETENLLENAREKLIQKNLDLIVANNLTESGAGFGADTNRVKIMDRTGAVEELPILSKDEVAGRILDRVESILA